MSSQNTANQFYAQYVAEKQDNKSFLQKPTDFKGGYNPTGHNYNVNSVLNSQRKSQNVLDQTQNTESQSARKKQGQANYISKQANNMEVMSPGIQHLGNGGLPETSIADRSKKWQEEKQKKQERLKEQKQMQEMANENLTFKPVINKPRTRAHPEYQGNQNTAMNTVGMQKYMERVQKANKLKQDKKQLEEKVFNSGKNWTPQITQPSAPKLTTKRQNFINGEPMMQDEGTGSRIPSARLGQPINTAGAPQKSGIKSLNRAYMLNNQKAVENLPPKGVNPKSEIQSSLQKENPILNLMLNNEQNSNNNPQNGLLKVPPNYNYEEAQQFIHSYIMQMDL